ncbi:hypothetical protein V5O48_009174 [Marasmius crinis-equi]|uniref:F-box domain-containing protein n=1 Tax=Marasmius crinis-equi TaxID=585013 RepID=A0ABR3FCJ8_9AGAR
MSSRKLEDGLFTLFTDQLAAELLHALRCAGEASPPASLDAVTQEGVLGALDFLSRNPGNSVARHEEVEGVHRKISLAKDHLEKLNQSVDEVVALESHLSDQISRARERRHDLLGAQRQLQRMCNQVELTLRPSIRSLPSELLLMTIELLLNDFEFETRGWLLQHKRCQVFPPALSTNPILELWTHVCLTIDPLDGDPMSAVDRAVLARNHIHRSRGLPLHIRLFCFPDSFEIPGIPYGEVLDMLAAESHRWQSAILYLNEKDTFKLPLSLPLLTELVVHTWGTDDYRRPSEPLQVLPEGTFHVPRLKNLRLFMDCSDLPLFATERLMLETLTHLEVSWKAPARLGRLFAVLRSTNRTLVELRLDKLTLSWDTIRSVELPVLQVLGIRLVHRKFSKAILNALTVPNLTTFEFVGGWYPEEPDEAEDHDVWHRLGFPKTLAVQKFIHRSNLSQTLRHVRIVDPGAQPDAIQEVLSALPSLTSLHLCLDPYSPVFAAQLIHFVVHPTQ